MFVGDVILFFYIWNSSGRGQGFFLTLVGFSDQLFPFPFSVVLSPIIGIIWIAAGNRHISKFLF